MSAHLIAEQGWSYKELWEGAILASIAHAIFVADAPELAHENSWDGFNYNFNDSQGIRGTITFHPDFFVAAFRNDEVLADSLNFEDYFHQAPKKVLQLAEEEALQYLLDDVRGKTLPSITTIIWGEKEQTFSSHRFDEMLENGGKILAIQSMNVTESLKACEEEFEFTQEQLMLLKKLYHLKIAQPNEKITLNQSDIEAIGSKNEEGINESKILFAEIGIEWI
ncbi:hypothetical protein [Planococcus alpniumensis]|uniref:hypothetical protein n=1 Tax=Planococcus alpniumensis TaxID=2708345 RepID=UPI001B8D9843|nr:hypothetical protein [Planococcus sp. MSAK28401]